MPEEKSVIQVEFDGLKELLNEKLNNVCKEIGGMNATLTDHNGRLKTVERIVEQAKGAGSVINGFWGVVGGGVISLIVILLKEMIVK
jgi:hypothetical protein